ncbi:hypothetical protein J2S43_007537 [Catenuloplanes nepalensis]|uniref:Uncharacterized protein n=1 Tax=Catenuloplanes nepalensis TaxID=587533 RepID=A0ABT9N5P6_9ACTN|nr:hypothetical protein [Catenuloplanes nepalensis]MDP9799025.1 hypothetical protein [Catenuloplanes nepalensis]
MTSRHRVPLRHVRSLFPANHPLTSVAARICRHSPDPCGPCWERAIRDDERVVVEFELPREIEPDRFYVDEIAVERACRGERVTLTRAERRAAVAALHDRGVTPTRIGRLLYMNDQQVRSALNAISQPKPQLRAVA